MHVFVIGSTAMKCIELLFLQTPECPVSQDPPEYLNSKSSIAVCGETVVLIVLCDASHSTRDLDDLA